MKARLFILLVCLWLFVLSFGFGQSTDNTIYARQFKGVDVATKVSNAMAACNPDVGIPCLIVVDPSLAAWPGGSIPPLCSHCFLLDYRNGPGVVTNFLNVGDFTAHTTAAFSSVVNGMNYASQLASIGASSGSHAGVFGIKIPSSSTVFEGIGVGSYVENHSSNTQGIGGNFISFCNENTTECWGANIVADTTAGLTSGVSLIGLEVDAGIQSPVSAYTGVYGVTSTLGGEAAPGVVLGSTAFFAARNHNNRQWHFGFQTAAGAISGAGLRLGAVCLTGACASQTLNLVARAANDAEIDGAVMQLGSDGALNFYDALAGGFHFNGNTTITGNLTVSGAPNVSGGYQVNGNTVIDSSRNITGATFNTGGSYKFNGTAGFTGTKTAGSCVLTIQGGIITNVTGC